MSNLAKRVEIAANVAILTVALLLGIALVQRFLLPGGRVEAPPPA